MKHFWMALMFLVGCQAAPVVEMPTLVFTLAPLATQTAPPTVTATMPPSPTPTLTATQTATRRPSSTPTFTLTPTLTATGTPTLNATEAAWQKYCRAEFDLRPQLDLLAACVVLSGEVIWTGYNPGDGDFTFDVRLDAGQEQYLNDGNLNLRNGGLHCEIEPEEAGLGYPVTGMRVVMVGAWTFDRDKGWNELHPVWHWEQLSN